LQNEADQVFLNPYVPGGLILVEAKVISLIDNYRQDQFSKFEAGGVLLGYRRGIHLHVTFATEPKTADKRTRFSFIRKDPYHQAYADKLWKKSGELIGYLGEWHTHPESLPRPSNMDINDWLRITSEQKCMCIFIIGSSAQPYNFHISCAFNGDVSACEIAK
jgi:integrative and conjugative element protein (TIGR02256 family)